MPSTRRAFGLEQEGTAGGVPYRSNTATISAATTWWPVTGGTFDPNVERIDRSAEVRGVRSATAPLPFRARPVVTVPVPAYRAVLETGIYRTLGSITSTTGSTASGFTHTMKPLQFGGGNLPANNVHIFRDDLHTQIQGGCFNRMTLNFPLDDQGTVEYEIAGLFAKQVTFSTAYTTNFTPYTTIMLLRDATMTTYDGASTAVPNLQGFSLTYNNNLAPQWYAGLNVVSTSVGTTNYAQTLKQWFPDTNKVAAAADITFSITFGDATVAEEVASLYAQIRKFTFTITGGPLSVTPAANETMTITIYNGVYTGGGTEALTARDNITASFDGGVFNSSIDSNDLDIAIFSPNDATLIQSL